MKASYGADPEKKAASKASYNADPEKKKAASKASYSADPIKRRLLHVPTQRKVMPKTLHLKVNPHEHTIPTTRKAGVLTEEPSMLW